jgi:hypothetical protein
MMEGILLGVGLLTFMVILFAGVGALVWMDHRHKERMKQMEQEERVRLIEHGLLDAGELARLRTEEERYRAAGAIGVATALGGMGAAALATGAIVGTSAGKVVPAWVLPVVWALTAAVVLPAVLVCLHHLKRAAVTPAAKPDTPRIIPPETAPNRTPASTNIQEKPAP